jgi:hypothetical protein
MTQRFFKFQFSILNTQCSIFNYYFLKQEFQEFIYALFLKYSNLKFQSLEH